VIPARHVAHIGSIKMAGTREPAQHPRAYLLLHRGAVLGCQHAGLVELDLPVSVLGEHAIDHAAVEVDRERVPDAELVRSALSRVTRRPRWYTNDVAYFCRLTGDLLCRAVFSS